MTPIQPLAIMGSLWNIEERSAEEDKILKDCDGYADWTKKLIVIEREPEGTLGDMEVYVRKVKRHEIVHAFLTECGMAESSGSSEAWAQNETMVDWLARIGPRIYKAWRDAGALDEKDCEIRFDEDRII